MRTPRTLVLFGISLVASVIGAASCGSKPPPTPPGPPQGSNDVATPDPTPDQPTGPTEPKPNLPPTALRVESAAEVFDPPYKKIGVGQTISFATTAIDQNLDEVRTMVTQLPASASFDEITQTVTWTPTKADLPKGEFELEITEFRPSGPVVTKKMWMIEVDAKKQVLPVAEQQNAIIETVLMIRQPKRLEQVNKDWPLDKMLLFTAENFHPQFVADKRSKLEGKLDKAVLFEQFLSAMAMTHDNKRLDPKAPMGFESDVFGDPKAWKIVAFRPRIDRFWTELRVVYQAVKAPEPVFAMFRIRPVVEYVPALPRPEEERIANNKTFLGLVAKHLLPGGAPSDKFLKDQAAHGKAVAAFMKEFMAYNEEKKAPYLRTFSIGIAIEARMGGGSARNPDGSYKSGDAWGWSAQKPFQTVDLKSQKYVNVIIPGFWTRTEPSENKKTWVPKCGPRWTKGGPDLAAGHDVLCRKTMGFVDLPDTITGTVKGGRIDANNLYIEHKNVFMVKDLSLEDPRRDVGEENGMTCSQCHIRNFGMHDYSDLAATDPTKGLPKTKNPKLATLNFQIIPSTHWEEFTLNFLKHQECRAKENYAEMLPDAAKGLGCPLAK